MQAIPAPELGAVEVPPLGPAGDDPTTATVVAARRRRSRQAVVVGVAPFVVMMVAAVALGAIGVDELATPWDAVAAIVLVLSFVAAVAVLMSHPMRTADRRRTEAVLRSPWKLVQAFGASVPNRRVGVVVIIEPDGTPVDQWIDATSPTTRWPADGERNWAWLAVDPAGGDAVISAPDRSELHRVVRAEGQREAPLIYDWAREQLATSWRFVDGEGRLVPPEHRAGEGRFVAPAEVERQQTLAGLRVVAVALGAIALVFALLGISNAMEAGDRRSDYALVEVAGRRADAVVVGLLDGAADGEQYLSVIVDGEAAVAVAGSGADLAAGDPVVVARGDADLMLIRSDLTHVVVGQLPDRAPWRAGEVLFLGSGLAAVAAVGAANSRRRALRRSPAR